jgi:hypothetical protein
MDAAQHEGGPALKKIVGFKFTLREKEIARRAKKAGIDLVALGYDQMGLSQMLLAATHSARSAVLFDTFSGGEAADASLAPMTGLAFSLIVATLGQGFDDFTSAQTAANPATASLWPIIAQAGLDECFRFANNLIGDEAAKDACELSPIAVLSSPEALSQAFSRIDSSKINVSFSDGRLLPSASSAVSVSWLARGRARKTRSC